MIKDYGFYDKFVIVGGDFGKKFLAYDPQAPIMPELLSGLGWML